MPWFSVFLLIHLCTTATRAVIKLPGNNTIPAVLMFGDSIVDTGNNNNLQTIYKVNFPPYGKDFIGGKPTGRFSDGKVPSDLLVEELGIKELLPPYLDPTLDTNDIRTGVNFASGGAGLDPLTSDLASVISLSAQINLFKGYIAKLRLGIGEEATSTVVSNGLFILVAGSNDITNTYFGNPIRKLHYDFNSYTDLLLNSASTFVQELYALGARRIGVFGIPPIGCLPSQRTLAGGIERNCADDYNQIAQLFNTKLSAEMNILNNKLPNGKMVYIDVYNSLMDLILNPHNYGFNVANEGCCGTGTIEVAFLCKFPCSDVSEYVFWDSFHPTEKTYRILVHEALREHVTSFF